MVQLKHYEKKEYKEIMEKTVEAVICGHEITSAEVDAFIASLPREQQVYASHPDFRKQCVDQLIAVYALAKYGEEGLNRFDGWCSLFL